MSNVTYEKELVGLLVVDPYNDFISEGGKVWGRVKEIAEAVNCVPNMQGTHFSAHGAAWRDCGAVSGNWQ
jgi:ureidoacrylate peracid hydrolase